MPRIDPLQLLKCLSVLLTPEGGILSRDEVPRLVNLMTKFSKKLVSKCVYVLILKSTETELVDMFMAEGGWTLIQTWLQDAVQTANWDLVREILGLLLVTPVDVERLKLNILPKLIKSLSRREELEGVAELSAKLVQQWLTIVKGSSNSIHAQNQAQSVVPVPTVEPVLVKPVPESPVETEHVNAETVENKEESKIEYIEEDGNSEISVYKTSGKSGKLIIRKLASADESKDEMNVSKDESDESKEEKDEKDKSKERRSSSSKSSKSSSSSRSSRDKSRSKDEDRDKDKKRSSSSSSTKSKDSSKSKERDRRDKERSKDKDKDKEKDRHRRNGEIKSSSTSKSSKDKKDSKDKDKDKGKHKSDKESKDKVKQDDSDKEKQAEKDKDTLAKLIPPPIDKLGRIPKKSNSSSSSSAPLDDKEKRELEEKKKSFSVGIRKNRDTNEERPKTVKVFNSKMRSTGLEEEIKPAPPRPTTGKKPIPSVQLPTIPPKRPSPPKDIREPIIPPEKKLKIDKIDVPERPGAIKLIPPKPKPMLQESDLFNDALTAATTKKETKKRKRRPSLNKDKDAPTSPNLSPAREPPATPTSPPVSSSPVSSSSLGLKNIAPINFYQDTLSSEDAEEKKEIKEVKGDDDEDKENESENVEEKTNTDEQNVNVIKEDTPISPPRTPTDDKEDEPLEPKRLRFDDGLKGVLLYTKKRGPKKSISWKNDSDLVEIRYFELDETERVNVTKTFGDMAKMDISSEREALQLSRKIGGEDVMESQIFWRVPFLLELDEPLAVPGSKSLEKDIQFAREKTVLQALYFDKRRIPDSPEEPIPENHQMSDPVVIPLEDPESQEIDLRTTPWPEPKGLPPQPEPKPVQPVFQNMPVPFQPPFSTMTPPAFQNMPQRFVAPGGPMGPVGPANFMPSTMMPPNSVMVPPNMGPSPHELMAMNQNMFNHGSVPENFVTNPENFGPMHDNFGPPGPDLFGPSIPDAFGPGPDGYGPGPDFPMFPNQNRPNDMNMFHSNKFRDHRQNNRGFRRGGGGSGGNSGGWKQISGNSNNWKKGRGGRLCKNVQNHGFCRNRDNCPFVHP